MNAIWNNAYAKALALDEARNVPADEADTRAREYADDVATLALMKAEA